MDDVHDAVVVQTHDPNDKIKCPLCVDGYLNDVKDSRVSHVIGHRAIRRRRVCNVCFSRTTTYEVDAAVLQDVLKKQTAKLNLAMQLITTLEKHMRDEFIRRMQGDTERVITPFPEDIL